MPLCLPIKDHKPIKIADTNKRRKPKNSYPILSATNNEYKIAVITPDHCKMKGNVIFI